MIKHWLVSGDTHGNFSRFKRMNHNEYPPAETAIFILGDAGINYLGWEKDIPLYQHINKMGYRFYCVKGNHEQDPSDIEQLELIYDPDVGGQVYMNKEYPNIRFLFNGLHYQFGKTPKTFVALGGAYSVDKPYRLANGFAWFEHEQLTEAEQEHIYHAVVCEQYDVVFSHTCPYSWRPVEKFLPFIDQSTVDERTEKWLENIYKFIYFKHWYMGHWHTYKTIDDAKGTGHFLFNEVVDLKDNKIILY